MASVAPTPEGQRKEGSTTRTDNVSHTRGTPIWCVCEKNPNAGVSQPQEKTHTHVWRSPDTRRLGSRESSTHRARQRGFSGSFSDSRRMRATKNWQTNVSASVGFVFCTCFCVAPQYTPARAKDIRARTHLTQQNRSKPITRRCLGHTISVFRSHVGQHTTHTGYDDDDDNNNQS